MRTARSYRNLVDVLHASGHGLLEVFLRLCQTVAFADWMLLHEMQMIGWEHDNGRVGTSKWRVGIPQNVKQASRIRCNNVIGWESENDRVGAR